MRRRTFHVYIMTSNNNAVLYTGVTSDLEKRVEQHKVGIGSQFTKKYHATKLVYYEEFAEAESAIAREKQIKGGSRKKKINLINKINSDWKDLFNSIST